MICLVTSSSDLFSSRSEVLMPLYSRKFEADWNEDVWKMVSFMLFPSLNGFWGDLIMLYGGGWAISF